MSDVRPLDNERNHDWQYDDESERDRPDTLRWKALVTSDKIASSGFSMGILEVQPGSELAPHHHHPQETYYVIEGSAEVYIEHHWEPFGVGDVTYFPGDYPHGLRNQGKETCKLVWVFPTDTEHGIEYFWE